MINTGKYTLVLFKKDVVRIWVSNRKLLAYSRAVTCCVQEVGKLTRHPAMYWSILEPIYPRIRIISTSLIGD